MISLVKMPLLGALEESQPTPTTYRNKDNVRAELWKNMSEKSWQKVEETQRIPSTQKLTRVPQTYSSTLPTTEGDMELQTV